MRNWIVAALVLFCWVGSAQENRDTVEPSAESQKLSRAAEEFARSVAGEGTPHYAKVFEHAIAAADIPPISGSVAPKTERKVLSVRPSGTYRGMVNDPRYFTNLYQTHKKKIPKIWGGQPVTGAAYSDVVAVLGNGQICTGTLITSNVVMTAAHCHYKGINEKVVFGNDISDPNAVEVKVRQPSIPLANAGEWATGDLALLFLEREVTTVTPRRIAHPDWIRRAQTLTAVGFGATEAGALGVKNVVDIVMTSAGCDGQVLHDGASIDDTDYYRCGRGIELVAGKIGLGKDTCGGDSGGPIYVAGPDGALYLAAATSRVVEWQDYDEAPCGDGGIYSRIDTASTWAASNGVTLQFGSVPTSAGTRSMSLPAETAVSAMYTMTETERPASEPTSPAASVRRESLHEIAAAGTELRGRIAMTPAGDAVLIPDERPAIRIPIVNLPDPSAAQDLPVNVTIDEISDGGVSVRNVKLSATDEFDAKRAVLTPLKYPRLTKIVGEINRSFAAHLQSPADAQTEQSLINLLREGESIAALALQKSDRGTPRFRAAKKVYTEIRRTNKAFYRRNDRYPPMAYERIFHNTRGTVALTKRDDGKPFCSGVLISSQYVMTNQHCSASTPSSNVEVKFNYELGLDDVALPNDVYRVTGYEFHPRSQRPLDVIFLKLDRPAVQQNGKPWPSQCLSTKLLTTGSPVYVVGHPRQSFRTVADNAHTLFPFEVTQDELTKLRGSVIADYEDQPVGPEILKDFDDSYKPFPLNQNETVYRYYSVETSQPTFGIDSDTAEGNSGSPVYSRRSHDVVGLFVGGIEGELDLDPGFAFHENVIPMSEIVRQMEEHHATEWTGAVQPCIDGLRLGEKCSCH